MEGNRDEAKRALDLARSYQTSDPIKALKFARKACALYWSPEAAGLVKTLETGEGPSTNTTNSSDVKSNSTATSSATKSSTTKSDQNIRSRTTPKPSTSSNQSSNLPNYKPSQFELVKKIRRHKVTQYYEILDLKRDCDESQVKSAYRKLALALHPDKNNAPGADEAFKMVSKAFQVLSDPDKRSAYDRHGADPDSRSAGIPTSTSFGAGRQGAQFGYEEGIDPEQLFRMFFGGSGGFDHPGMQFGGGPTVFQFGGGGTTFRRAGFSTRSQQHNQNQPVEVRNASTWLSLLPIVLFFLVSLFQSFPSLFSSSTPDPSISWTPNSIYPIQRVTHTPAGVTYFVNPIEFATHPSYQKYVKLNPELTKGKQKATATSAAGNEDEMISEEEKRRRLVEEFINESKLLLQRTQIERQRLNLPRELRNFERDIEASWTRKLQFDCQTMINLRDAKKRELMGFLGLRPDWEAIKKLDSEVIPSCEELKKLGYAIN